MASNISQNGNNFEALYESPWGGMNTDEDPTNIQLNQFANCLNVRNKLGVITSSFFAVAPLTLVNFTHPAGTGTYYVGMVSVGRYLIFFDEAGNILHYDPTANLMRIITASGISQFTCYKAINGSIYISDYTTGIEYQYTPTSYTTGSLNTGATYVGGKYSAVLKNYWILANTNQISDSPAIKPARVNWSSPNAYLTFDPTVDRTAGFNVLADVTDEITGLFIQGNVGYILRTQGITQFSPTGDALAPFSFDSLWADDYGVGCDIPDSVSTFGAMAIFGDSSGIYNFQGGITDISQGIKRALQTSFQNANSDDANSQSYISGTLFGNAFTDKSTDVSYALLIGSWAKGSVINTSIVQSDVFIYSVHDKSWSQHSIDLQGILRGLYPGIAGNYIAQPNLFKMFRAPKIQQNQVGVSTSRYVSTKFVPYVLISGVYGSDLSQVHYNLVIQLFEEDAGATEDGISNPIEIDFKTLEFKIARKPTISRVMVRASGQGTITPSINGRNFTPIVIGSDLQPQLTTKTYSSSGMFTGEEPQLTLTSTNFRGKIVKVMEKGIFADGDLI